jgi:hypothetical protein
MNLIKLIGIASTLVVSTGANAFGLGDALSTVNEVSKTVNQLSTPQQVAPIQAVQPTPVSEAPITTTASNETKAIVGCEASILNKIGSSVHPKQKVYGEFASCKKMPNNPELTIVAELLEGAEDSGFGNYDLSVVVAKSDSGDVVGKYFKEGFFNSGAGGSQFEEIKVDTANYRLNADTRAFGVVSHTGGRDGGYEEITLFVLNGTNINPVLINLGLINSIPITIGDCIVGDYDIKRTVIMTSNVTNGYFDITVNEKKTKYKVTKKSCEGQEEKIDKTTSKKYTLKYDNKKGVYNAPAEIASPDL